MSYILSKEIIAFLRFVDLKYDTKYMNNPNSYSYTIKDGYEDLIRPYVDKMCRNDHGQSFWSWILHAGHAQQEKPTFYNAAVNNPTDDELIEFIKAYLA